MKRAIIFLKSLIKGLLTYLNISTSYDSSSDNDVGTTRKISARYCYSVWMRHLVLADKNNLNSNPKKVGELGPGDSLGSGLAALLSGAENYKAFDVVQYASIKRNLKIFDELVVLFQNREPIPDDNEFPKVKPFLDNYDFPHHILTEKRLNASLDKNRINNIRNELKNSLKGSSYIQYMVPWFDKNVIEKNSLDLVFSQAVMEHVEDIESTYRSMNAWLKKGAYISHQIDFKSHGITYDWNGHWTYSDFMWKVIKGKRLYFINRATYSDHLRSIKSSSFKIVDEIPIYEKSEIQRYNLAKRFKSMTDNDLNTSGLFVQATVN